MTILLLQVQSSNNYVNCRIVTAAQVFAIGKLPGLLFRGKTHKLSYRDIGVFYRCRGLCWGSIIAVQANPSITTMRVHHSKKIIILLKARHFRCSYLIFVEMEIFLFDPIKTLLRTSSESILSSTNSFFE